MPLTTEERAEINRQNARKSTGPKTEAGKAISRGNALKHGLAATTIDPVDVPGEPPGAYQARLNAWIDDLNPRNVLELSMIQRACRASWKLDRCARYEDAAAALREALGGPGGHSDLSAQQEEAAHLGALLMFPLNSRHYAEAPPDTGPPIELNQFDDAPRDADALGRFPEGVAWLLDAWVGVLPNLPADVDPAPEGSEEFLRRSRMRACRLLGIPTGAPPPAQPLRQAGEAEVRRLQTLLAEMTTQRVNQLDADLSLFSASPEAQLLMRYEAQAERELHRSVNTFLKLRKDPDLVPTPEPRLPEPPEEPVKKPAAPRAKRTQPDEPPRSRRVERKPQVNARVPRIDSP